MLPAIQLDDQAARQAAEVDDERPDWILTAELHSRGSSVS
jgi:hypothetical protein